MDPPVYDTLILSDLHLGSECSRARDATRVLRENRFHRLILLGDIFADLNFARLTKDHWKFLGAIRKLSNPKREVEIVWVEGNHDHGLSNLMSHLVGVKVFQEYSWTFDGLRHLAIHGHQFDRFVINNMRVNYLGTLLYLQLQKMDFKGKPIARFIDRLNTRWLRMTEKVASGALHYARLNGADLIFCGHTHVAMHQEEDGVQYFNVGGWVDSHPTYLTIDYEGVQIHEYRERPDDRNSGEERSGPDSAPAEQPGEPGLFEDEEYESVGG
jgi:UDP-2,3-diacylglucosamine pyrophosphatase LpxH